VKKLADIASEITRRQWLLRLGEVGVLAGVSGFVPDALASIFDDTEKTLALPPGLYEPSADAMVHALSHHGMVIPPPGSESEFAVLSGPAFQPRFFSREEFAIVTQITEIVLGKIDGNTLLEVAQWIDLWFHSAEGVRQAALHLDPMHRTLAVAYYGEQDVRELETVDHATAAREGFAALHRTAGERYGKKFGQLDRQQQAELLQAAAQSKDEDPLRMFLHTLRNEAIRGYYTSAAGLKELDYKGNAYNPECPGCELGGEKSAS
jgi:hypothetical protein